MILVLAAVNVDTRVPAYSAEEVDTGGSEFAASVIASSDVVLPDAAVAASAMQMAPLDSSAVMRIAAEHLAEFPSVAGSSSLIGSIEGWSLPNGVVYLAQHLTGEGLLAGTVGLFLDDGLVVGTSEMAVVDTGDRYLVHLEQDGVMVLDEDITEVVRQAEMDQSSDGLSFRSAGFSWSTFNRCLSTAGISQAVIMAITIACSAVCVGTAGLGCLACITAAGLVGSGTIGYCWTKATS